MNNAEEYYNRSSQSYVSKWDLSPAGLDRPANLYRQTLVGALLEAGGIKNGDRVVEIGCGTGLVLRELLKKTSPVFGVDISRQMLERVRDSVLKDRRVVILGDLSRTEGQTGDAFLAVDDFLNLRLPERHFDKILSLEVLRYVDDLGWAFANTRKIMKEETVFVFTMTNLWSSSFFPLKYSLREWLGRLDAENELLQYFVTERLLREKIEESEFKIIRFEKLNLLSANPLVVRLVKSRRWAERIIWLESKLLKMPLINKFCDTFLVAVKRAQG